MSNILTQEEIDTLLGGLTGGSVIAPARASVAPDAGREALSYDLFNQDRIIRGGMPTLEVIHDRFARLLRTALTQAIRRAIDVQILSHTDIKFGEFSRTLPTPSSLHVLKLEPLSGLGLLVLPGTLIYTLIDIYFGGSGSEASKQGARDFTLIEQRIISNLTEIFDRQYAEAWRPVYPLKVQSAGSETNPQFINIAQASDIISSVDYEISIDGMRCGLSICLPFATIDPIKETLRGSVISESAESQDAWGPRIAYHLRESVVEVRALLGSATITVQELRNLRVGDIIQLEEDYEHPIDIRIQDVPKFWGVVGSHKSTRAVQITGIQDERKMKNG